MCRDYVLLTPKDLLTKDENWINRHDFLDGIESISNAVPDLELRPRVNQYLVRELREEYSQKDKRRVYSLAY